MKYGGLLPANPGCSVGGNARALGARKREFKSLHPDCGRSQVVRRRIVTALYVGSIPTGHPTTGR
jgi:hypothetical protein